MLIVFLPFVIPLLFKLVLTTAPGAGQVTNFDLRKNEVHGGSVQIVMDPEILTSLQHNFL